MFHLHTFLLLVTCFFLRQHVIQATVFTCDRKASCGCSKVNADINSRIVGGENAVQNSWGWAISYGPFTGEHVCGGTILSPNYILTAAHCVASIAEFPYAVKVTVGTNILSSGEGHTYSISKIIVHPDYFAATYENDIAILALSTPINFTDPNVARICLPDVSPSSQSQYPVVKSSIVAIGWGTTQSGGMVSDSLQQVTVNTVASTEKKCNGSIHNVQLQFCAAVGGGGKDACQGDSGGPIMYYSPEKQVWILAGITSYGRGCGLADHAGVYTRVTMYINWIKSIVGDGGIVTVPQNKSSIILPSNSIIFIIILFSILPYIYN